MRLGFFPSANYWRNTFRTLDYSRIAYYALSILLPATTSLSWLLREKSRRQSFYDAGYDFVPDDRVQCKHSFSQVFGVDYDNTCERLLGQTFGLFWEMLLIPLVFTIVLTFVAKAKGFGELAPTAALGAWFLSTAGLQFLGFALPFFVVSAVIFAVSLLIVLIQNR